MTDQNPYAAQVDNAIEKQQAEREKQARDTAANAIRLTQQRQAADTFIRDTMDAELTRAQEGLASRGFDFKRDITQGQFPDVSGGPTQVLATGVLFWLEKGGRQVGQTYHLNFGVNGWAFSRTTEQRGTPSANPFAGGLKRAAAGGRGIAASLLQPQILTSLYVKGAGPLGKEHAQAFILDAINEVAPSKPLINDRLLPGR